MANPITDLSLMLSQLPTSNSITQILGERILPNILPKTGVQSGSTCVTHPSTSPDRPISESGPEPNSSRPLVVETVSSNANHLPSQSHPSSSTSTHLQLLQQGQDDDSIQQLRELFKPRLRCSRATWAVAIHRSDGQRPSIDLIERWIFQLNDHHPWIFQLKLASTDHAALCDLFHPLIISNGRTGYLTPLPVPVSVPVAISVNELSECDGEVDRAQVDTDESCKKDLRMDSPPQRLDVAIAPSTTSCSTSSSSSYDDRTNITLMDLIMDLYAEFGICRDHEYLVDYLDELTRLPHQLWESWSKNQRPLIQPLIHRHLIPDLTNITLEYLLGNESTVPIQIERKPQPTYRWRIPLLEWRRENEAATVSGWRQAQDHTREYSPEFELEGGLRWRLLVFPSGSPHHHQPNCLAVYLELRQQPLNYNVPCSFKFRMIHPVDPAKSVWRDSSHMFTSTETDRGFNNLLTPDVIQEFTHTEDECVVIEVAAWKEPHPDDHSRPQTQTQHEFPSHVHPTQPDPFIPYCLAHMTHTITK